MNASDLEMIRQVLYKGDSLPFCFYGKYARCGLALSMDGRAQIHVAPIKEEKNANGNKTYDNDARVDFTLNFNECLHISNNIKDVLAGTYVNPNEQNEQYKHTLSIIHYPKTGNKTTSSRLIIAPVDKIKNAIKLTIMPSSDSGKKSLSYVFNYNPNTAAYESTIFINFLKKVGTDGPYNDQYRMSVIKSLREMIRLQKESAEEFQKSGGSSYKSNTGGGNTYNKQSKPPQKQTPPPEDDYSSGSGDSEIDFDAFGDSDDGDMPF